MFIGVDIGGTFIKYALYSDNFNEVYKDSIPTVSTKDGILYDLILTISNLDKIATEKGSKVKAVGIGVPGVVERGSQKVIECKNLGWVDVDLKMILEMAVELPVYIDNDANLAALAEFHFGALKGSSSGVLLTLGTGIGSGTIVNGEILRGEHGLGQELGHTVIGDNFYNCSCGKNGCFETFSSATAVVMYAREQLRKSSIFSHIKWKRKKSISAKNIFEMAKKGDSFALEVVERTTTYLARGIVNIINTLDPSIIALGGGMATSGELLINLTRVKIRKELFLKNFPSAKLELALIGNDAGTLGAALMARDYKE